MFRGNPEVALTLNPPLGPDIIAKVVLVEEIAESKLFPSCPASHSQWSLVGNKGRYYNFIGLGLLGNMGIDCIALYKDYIPLFPTNNR